VTKPEVLAYENPLGVQSRRQHVLHKIFRAYQRQFLCKRENEHGA
jgi:hypothetical protein